MRIFVPFTRLSARTYVALPTATFVPLVDKEYGYGKYFQERWAEGETFINVEHDIVPTTDILESMWHCTEMFCLSGYHYPEQDRVDIAYLGCAKISKEFIQTFPDAFTELKRWNQCDAAIWQATKETHCQHGSVLHLHVDSCWPQGTIEKYGR